MQIKHVAVVGSGTMGSGIAQVAATAGCSVLLYDTNAAALSKAEQGLKTTLVKLVEKGKLDESKAQQIQENIRYTGDIKDLNDSELIIEAIIENLEVKRTLFKTLEGIVSPGCILATNTSSLSIASIAASVQEPGRVVGIHFFNPAPLMQLVEVIPAVQTSTQTLAHAVETITAWNKVVALAKDTPGFIVNRVARPFYSEAIRIYEEGIADFATIDHAMKSVYGFRMGPFELMDFIGNDVNYAVTESVFTAFYFDPRYKPSFTQKRLTEAGYLGRKTGRGYYDYLKESHLEPLKDEGLLKRIADRILVMLINEAADACYFNVASAKDIDHAMTKGVNYPKGLLAWADELSIAACVEQMDALYTLYHEDRYRCSVLLRNMQRDGKTFFSA
ncbi:MAG: 3-hydroxyacyl-CoA dehydrogenase NAD-binding domain-containing protein [Bacteroidia bacterium]|jgi:3-hydroxybutyryl-CoA dehydrogenase